MIQGTIEEPIVKGKVERKGLINFQRRIDEVCHFPAVTATCITSLSQLT